MAERPASSRYLTPSELVGVGLRACGTDVSIDRTAILLAPERIEIGSHVRIDAHCVLSAGAGGIAIGSHVHLAALVTLSGAGRITLADFVGLSAKSSVFSANDDYRGGALTGPTVPDDLRAVHVAPVTLEAHVIVGAGSVLLPGTTLALGASVGALSLVRGACGPFEVLAGVPARVVGRRERGLLEREQDLRHREAR